MQSNDPFSHASNGLNPTFEYDPFSSENYRYRLQPHTDAHDSHHEEPDDFYRPYAERSSQPDIIVQRNEHMMAVPTKPRRSSATGTAARSPAAGTPPQRLANRTFSGPAGPRGTTLISSKSAPLLPTALNTRNGYIKERVKQLEKIRGGSPSEGGLQNGRSRAPPASNTAAGAQRFRPAKTPTTASPKARVAPSSGRPPLFGEVVDTGLGAEEAGYGISEFANESEGSMHQPNAMFARSRSQSDMGSPAEETTADHQRSRSDDSSVPVPHTGSGRSSSEDPASPNTLPQSRIPIPTGRTSDFGSRNANSKQRLSDARSSSSPMLLTSRRYSPPKKYLDASNTLTAMVKAPPPKLSPPLRSTRNRQPVNTAATGAPPRAKAGDRFNPAVSTQTTASSRAKAKIPFQVDIAERRARLQKNLEGAPRAKPVVQDLKNLRDGKYPSHRTDWVEADAASDVSSEPQTSRKSSTTISVPLLAIETVDDGQAAPPDIVSAGASTEFEESPVLGHNETPKPVTYPPPPQVNGSEGFGEAQDERDQGLLKQVMGMRQTTASMAAPPTEVPDDYFTQVDDGETINILLGATPQLPAQNWSPEMENQASSPEAFHTPREESGSEFDILDNRSSIVPDDSVSMVFQRKYADMIAREPPPPMPTHIPNVAARRAQNFTLTSDARSEINRVLDRYQDEHVTPEMAHGFQERVEALTPNMSRHDAWESPEATKNYLRNALSGPDPDQTPREVDPSTPKRPKAPQTQETPSDVGSPKGVAIIYGSIGGRDEEDEPLERTATLHSHSTSNATLRPSSEHLQTDDKHRSYLEDISFRPAPPPKDLSLHSPVEDPARITSIPSLPEFSGATSGLGLSMSQPVINTPPRSPHPPAPGHAPPAPPTPIKDEMTPQATPQAGPSPTVERKPPFDMMPPGLPSSPAATRGRVPPMAEKIHPDGARSAGPSLDISSTTSRNQSPFSIARSTNGNRSSQSLATPDTEKELTQRRHRIKELVDTEHTFHQDLTIMTDIYLATAENVLGEEDRRTLFGNIEQLRTFTTDFLDELKRAAAPIYVIPREQRWNYKRGSFTTSNSETTENSASTTNASIEERLENDRKTTIGRVFCENLPTLQKVYSEWLRGANAANKRLAELQSQPAVKYWLDECIESHKDLTQAWNLDSLIVKPFQRSAKYTLLLDEILKFTQSEHPDHLQLKQAKDLVKAYNERANDVQKRTELVEQAMSKQKDANGRMKVGKLLNRRTEKLKQQVGLTGQAEDPDYDAIAQKFGGHFFQLQVVMRDVEKYLEDVHHYVDQYVLFMEALTNNISGTDARTRYPVMESRWLAIQKAIVEMKTYALSEHMKQVRKSVIDPIQHLWRLHVGPQKMMAKRKKRLVEYIRCKNMIERGEKPDKHLEQNADQFRAVNETLKEELPRLYALTKQLVDACLLNFIDLQVQWQQVWTRKLGPLQEDLEEVMNLELPQSLFSILNAYSDDVFQVDEELAKLRLCNKELVTEARNFKSPATTYSRDDDSSFKRPSTLGSNGRRAMSQSSEQTGHNTPNIRLSGDNMALSPLAGPFGLPDGVHYTHGNSNRSRAASANTSRGPSTPYGQPLYTGPGNYYARPTTADHPQPSPGVPRMSLDSPSTRSPARHEFGNQYVLPDARLPVSPAAAAEERYSGIFSSALPMSDSPRPASPEYQDGELGVMFLAASLFEFHIDGTRKEGGYPYLTYQPGEIFDVVAQKGELWLARNQDDASGTIGWIWEKHFARILQDN